MSVVRTMAGKCGVIFLLLFGSSCDTPNSTLPRPLPIQGTEYSLSSGFLFEGAVVGLRSIQPASLSDNTEYCGYIAFEQSTNEVVRLDPVRGNVSNCAAPLPGPGYILVASYHSQGAPDRSKNSERPSYQDAIADTQDGVIGYVSTPQGNLWLVDPRTKLAYELCNDGCINRRNAIPSKVARVISFDELQDLDGL